MHRQEKQLGLVQSVMACVLPGRAGWGWAGEAVGGGVEAGCLLDQSKADNEEVNKRNGT